MQEIANTTIEYLNHSPLTLQALLFAANVTIAQITAARHRRFIRQQISRLAELRASGRSDGESPPW